MLRLKQYYIAKVKSSLQLSDGIPFRSMQSIDKTLVVHATNVTGLGATQVVRSILDALDSRSDQWTRIRCYLPAKGPLSAWVPQRKEIEVSYYRRRLPKSLSRVIECVLPRLMFDLGDALFVLGDVPLRSKLPQVVFIHQAHLMRPEVCPHAKRSFASSVMRRLVSLNSGFASQVVVQTQAMLAGIAASYRKFQGKVSVVGQPVPNWFNFKPEFPLGDKSKRKGLRLFYPAAFYPHKNHEIFKKLAQHDDASDVLESCVLTITEEEFGIVAPWVQCVGRLGPKACLAAYADTDVLVFPSLNESYGLPLIEAMSLGLPIVVANLPYAKAVCGDEGIYFDPTSEDSLMEALRLVKDKLSRGWQPDWNRQLSVLPHTWNEVVDRMLYSIESPLF